MTETPKYWMGNAIMKYLSSEIMLYPHTKTLSNLPAQSKSPSSSKRSNKT